MPTYAQVTFQGNSTYTYHTNSTDPEAGSSTPRAPLCLNATWVADSFSIQVALNDGLTHRVALYALDTGGGAANRFDVLDSATGAVLDSRTLTNFQGGDYLSWNLSGAATIRVTNLTAGSNAVVNGLFFG